MPAYSFNPLPVGTVVETAAINLSGGSAGAFNPLPIGTVVETVRVKTIAGIGV